MLHISVPEGDFCDIKLCINVAPDFTCTFSFISVDFNFCGKAGWMLFNFSYDMYLLKKNL